MKSLSFIFLVFISTLAYGQSQSKYVEKFILTDPINKIQIKLFADSINHIGKGVIPVLIENMARFDRIQIRLGKPSVSSFSVNYFKDNYCGIRSAYFIEWLLWTKNPHCYDYEQYYKQFEGSISEDVRINMEYYRYRVNLLFREGGKQLTYKDMLKVQSILKKWWEQNRHLEINELRQKYDNDSIWNETPYKWE